MFNPAFIIEELARNRTVFAGLLQDCPAVLRTWKSSEEAWSLLEIVCHLHDEEREDFRQRVRLVLEDPSQSLPPFNPLEWVSTRDYARQDYQTKLSAFLTERDQSIQWLLSLQSPQWDNTYQHASLGPMSAGLFLANWLAHDQQHIRQINRLKRQFLQEQTGMDLRYAGNW